MKDFLFRPSLSERIKGARALEEMGQDMKIQSTSEKNQIFKNRGIVNWKTPPAKKFNNNQLYFFSVIILASMYPTRLNYISKRLNSSEVISITYLLQLNDHTKEHSLKLSIKKCSIDVSKFTVHFIKHEASSKAFSIGIDLNTIRQASGWFPLSQASAKFYNKPIVTDNRIIALSVLK